MADYSNALMGGVSLIQMGAELGSAYAQSQALRAQGDFAVTMNEINQRFANERARDVERTGEDTARKIKQRAQSTIGAQRAGAAAQGIAVDDGSAADLTSDTTLFSEDEQITARNNAWREAFGIKTQAVMQSAGVRMQRRGMNAAADGTLLGGALSATATGLKATGFGLKAYRDFNPLKPDPVNAVATPNERDYNLGTDTMLDTTPSFTSAFFKGEFQRRKGGY